MSRPFATWIFLGWLVSTTCYSTQTRDARATELAFLAQKTGAIHITQEQYSKYVLNPHRNYHLLLLFSYRNLEMCPLCKNYDKPFHQAARIYERAGPIRSKSSSQAFPVFFIVVEADLKWGHQFHRLEYVPQMFFVGSSFSFVQNGTHFDLPQTQYPMTSRQTVAGLIGATDAFLNASEPTVITQTVSEQLSRFIVSGLFFLLVAYAVFLLYQTAYYNPKGLGCIAVVVHIIAASGLIWCVLHGFHLLSYDATTKKVSLFAPSARQQSVLEGLTMSTSFFILGFLFYTISKRLASPKQTSFAASLKLMCGLIFLYVLMAWTFTMIAKKLGLKPHISIYPPPGLIKGPMTRDRGRTVL